MRQDVLRKISDFEISLKIFYMYMYFVQCSIHPFTTTVFLHFVSCRGPTFGHVRHQPGGVFLGGFGAKRRFVVATEVIQQHTQVVVNS